jgi:hypothetical protein
MNRAAGFALLVAFVLGTTVQAQQEIIQRGTTTHRVNEPFTVVGQVVNSNGCWLMQINSVPPLVELDSLPLEFQRAGLRVVATVHVEADETGKCVSGMMHFLDDIALLEGPYRPSNELLSYYTTVRGALRDAGIQSVSVIENDHVRVSQIDPADIDTLRRILADRVGLTNVVYNIDGDDPVVKLWPASPAR